MFKHLISAAKGCMISPLLATETVLAQQHRTTFILKRRWPPNLYKKNQKHSKLRGRHFVYDLVEDTTIVKKQNMELVLTEFVEGVGKKGDVVSVKPYVAYNKLLLPGLAAYKTPENIEKYARTQDDEDQEKHSSPFAQRTVNMLQRMTLAVVMNKDHPWKIEKWHIKASLRKAGYQVTEETIELPETPITGPDLLKQNKDFYVTVTVNNLEKAQLRCRIHHWSTDPSERLPYVLEHWKEESEPLFGSSEPKPAEPTTKI